MYVYTPGHSRLVSVGTFLPEDRVTSRQLLQDIDTVNRFGVSYDWIDKTMGIRERRVASPDTVPSDMATSAAREALELAELRPTDIDAIIYAGVIKDYLVEPATAHVVQDKLRASNAIAFDVTNACHGFMNAMHLMDALIATGQVRRGLIVSGEHSTTHTFKALEALRQTTDRRVFLKLAGGLTVGDAGAAMIMGPKLGPDAGFMGFQLQSQGQFSELCTCGKGGRESLLETDMPAIIAHGKAMLGEMYGVLMRKLGWYPGDITKFIAHQVGQRALKHHAEYAQVSLDIMPETASLLGNLVTANIPLNLYYLQKNREVSGGDKIFIAGAGSGLSVSQSGLVWDAA